MPLKEELPESIKELLKEQKICEEDILLALQSDLNEKGQFSPTWLIATKEKILVISTDTKPKLLQSLPLKDYKSFKAEVGVGGGFFSACSDGHERRLLRFTTATARKFQVAASALFKLVNEGQHPSRYPNRRGKQEGLSEMRISR